MNYLEILLNADSELVDLVVTANTVTGDVDISALISIIWIENICSAETYTGKKVGGIVTKPICNIFYSPSLLKQNYKLNNLQEKDTFLIGRGLPASFVSFLWFYWIKNPYCLSWKVLRLLGIVFSERSWVFLEA